AERFGEHVVDTGRLEDLPGRAASNHAGAGRGGLQQHAGGVVLADHGVGDRGAREWDGEEVLLRLLHPLLDRGRNLLRLAVAQADVAGTATNDDERGEREPPPALHHLGNPVDGDDSLVELTFGHDVLSELQTAGARAVGYGRDATVVLESTAIEHDG